MRIGYACWLGVLGCLVGCGLQVPVVVSPAPPAGSGMLRAGAAEVDLTPPAGLGTWGHGPDARPSRGHRGRLRCRVIYLEDARGERVALVPCDFAAMDLHLQRAVARAVDPRVGLGADRLLMSATHTHGGPGHYFAARNYNGLFSGEVRGYDPRFVAWIAERVAAAIERAHDTALPARLGWATRFVNGGTEAEAAIAQNRSLPAHCANHDPMHGAASTCRSALADPIAEVEGRLDLLRIDVQDAGASEGGAGFRPLALYASFPVHGTSVPNTNVYFEADLWGFAARELEARLGEGGGFVAGLANGAEGDVRPSYAEQGWEDARRLGLLLAERIAETHAGIEAFETEPRITLAYRDVRLPGARAPGGEERACPRPELGRSAPGGSEEGRTGRYGPRWHEGMVDEGRRGCHRPADAFFLHRFASAGFPEVAPLMMVGIGSGTLVAYPWEMTTTAGLRLRARVREALATEGSVALIGLANEYLQYLTTPEEYGAQHYEGASTIYGPHTLAVVEGHFVQLAGYLLASRGGAPAHVEMRAFETSRPLRRDLWYDAVVALPPRIDEDRSGRVRFEEHEALQVVFAAGAPASVGTDGAVIARLERRGASGRFEPAFDALGRPLDDTHEDLVFEHLAHGRRVGREVVSAGYAPDGSRSVRAYRDLYRVVFVPSEDTPAGEYRFVVLGAGVERPSPPIPHVGGR